MLNPEEKREIRQKTSKPLMWVGIISIIMFFAGLTSGYVVIQADSFWVKADLPVMFNYSTAIIIASSLTMILAIRSAKKDNFQVAKLGLLITLILGIAFCVTQFMSWQELTAEGKFFVGNIENIKGVYGQDYVIEVQGQRLQYVDGKYYGANDRDLEKPLNEMIDKAFNASSSFLYIISALHMAHLAFAILFLLIGVIKAFMNKYTVENTLGLEVVGIFWHFLGGLWIYLFLFLLFIR